MNPRSRGPPAVAEGQRYDVAGRDVCRVDAGSLRVIGRVFGASPGLFQ